MQKVDSGPKAGKSAYFTHPDFSAAKLNKSAQITRVNTVFKNTTPTSNKAQLLHAQDK
jgi:hypothetical protein